jgi:hypothetical protein
LGEIVATNQVVMPAEAGIQYAAAYRLDHSYFISIVPGEPGENFYAPSWEFPLRCVRSKAKNIREAPLRFSIAAAGFFLATLISIPALAQTRALVTEEMMVKTSDPGIEIYVRNKRPADMTSFRPEQTVLYVHGATYPSETAFDLKLDGVSWMEYIASRGYDVWLLDLRGYGKSTRPAEMADKPEANAPIVTGQTAVRTSAPRSTSSAAPQHSASQPLGGPGARR